MALDLQQPAMTVAAIKIVLLATEIMMFFTEVSAFTFTKAVYNGEVHVHQPRHIRIVQVTIDPVSSLQDVTYFSNDIDEQFYIHSQTGYVMVNSLKLITGNYTFSVNINATGVQGSPSTTIFVRVLPEFYFAATEQDGSYLAYIPTDAPVGTPALTIMPRFTLLTDTMFNCSIDEEPSFFIHPDGTVMLANTLNSNVLEQFTVKCSAIAPSSSIAIETLTVRVTIVIYLISDLQASNLSISTDGLLTWAPPMIIMNQNLIPLESYEIRIHVHNGDIIVPFIYTLPSEAKNYTYQPVIAGTTLNISLIATYVRGITGVAKTTESIEGPSLSQPQVVDVRTSSVPGELRIDWQLEPSTSIANTNVTGYVLRLLYNASQAYTNESIPVEMLFNVSASNTSWNLNLLPGNTSYNVTIIAIYPEGQRIPSSPFSGFLPGYAPSDVPNITEALFLPSNSFEVTWRTLYFSNGVIMNYTVEFTANSGDNFVLTTTNTTVHTYATINFTHVTITVRASNQYGPGPKSTPMRIYTTGGAPVVVINNVTDSSACFSWSPSQDTKPLSYTIVIDDTELNTTTGNFYCERRLPQGSSLSLVIRANYPSDVSIGSMPIIFHTVTPPSNVIVAMVTSTSAMIQWEEPSPLATNGSTLRRYDILIAYVDIASTLQAVQSTIHSKNNSEELSLNLSNLMPGINYTVNVTAVYSGNETATASPLTFATPVTDVPSIRPNNLSLVSFNTTSLQAVIQWSPVQYSNGPVTGYRVQIQKSNQFNVYGATNNTAALTLATLSDTVLVKVSALNDVGCGPSTPQNFSLNLQPGSLRYFFVNNSSIRLFWDPPTIYSVSVDFLHYKMIVHAGASEETSISVDANSYTYSNLQSSTMYSFQIAAVYLSNTSANGLVHIQTADCTNEICLNGGTCINFTVCMCMTGYTGDLCESPVCDPPCSFGGMCVASPNICDCSSLFNGTGGTDECYGGRVNASCHCECYDGLFTGVNCTEPLYVPVLLLKAMPVDVLAIITLSTPVSTLSVHIVNYMVTYEGAVMTSSSTFINDHRNITTDPTIEDSPFNVTAQISFLILEHSNDSMFNVSSKPVALALHNCGPNMYGGFNDTFCQACPDNSVNERGYLVKSCACAAGYTGPDGGPCFACNEGTFKSTIGNTTCQNCPSSMSSVIGSTDCSCAKGYEPSEHHNVSQCRACAQGHYKNVVGNSFCVNCPIYSMSRNNGSTSLSNCTCVFSSGNASNGCYAFENQITVRASDVSSTWVMISWDPLGRVEDHNGNPQGTVQGYYIQVIDTMGDTDETHDAMDNTDGTFELNINVSSNTTSYNITNLQQESQYSISLSPYIEGFALGPPTNITVDTPPPSSPEPNTSDGGSSTVVIIISAIAATAILTLLVMCCCIVIVVYKWKKHTEKAAIISKSTIKKMKDDDGVITNPTFKRVTAEVTVENPTFMQPAENSLNDTTLGAAVVYANPDDDVKVENEYEKKRTHYLQLIAGQEKVATPEDYDDEALYTKMTQQYYDPDDSSILSKEISRNKLLLLDQLGKGEFGRVMKGIASEVIAGESKTLVAVKMLKEGISDDDKKDFLGEAHLLSQFKHPNVLSLLGIVTIDEPVLIIIPFMKNGDLRSFLVSANCKQDDEDDAVKLSYGDKLDIAVQIATGMEYLASRYFIHRDLAARNILVGEKLHVKISDFGMSRALAKEETYYKLNSTAKLPIKWMAIESIDFRKFSTFSDVWSFGVVVWEIFSFGMIPYKGMPNESLSIYLRSNKRLAKPADCSDEIYQLMQQCWMERKERRPTFTELKKEISALLAKEGVNSEPGGYAYYI